MIKNRITDQEIAILDGIALEISKAGHQINALHNCRNGKDTYILALPILLSHIDMNYSNIIKEEIVQSFADRSAYNAAYKKLISIYLNINKNQIKEEEKTTSRYFDTLAWSLSVMMGKDDIDDMVKIIHNTNLSGTRIFFIRRILRFKFNRKQEIIDFMLSDPDLYKEAAARLKIKKTRH